MAKHKYMDDAGLDDIFNLPDELESDLVDTKTVTTTYGSTQNVDNKPTNDTDTVEERLKTLLSTANTLLDDASGLISNTVSPEGIMAVSTMVNSVTSVISELNKTILIQHKFKANLDLEREKAKLRAELVRERMSLQTKKNNPLAVPSSTTDGNPLQGGNYQQNNYLIYSQEDIVRKVLEQVTIPQPK